MELRHLRYFMAVAEELSFSKAAERVHIDQTPISRAVRDLEDELGVALFVRAPRKLRLTPAGVRLLEDARKIFIRIGRIKRAVLKTHLLYQAPLRVGVADGIAQPLLSKCLIRWQMVAPEVPLILMEMRALELVAALKSEDVDIGFTFGVPGDNAIAQIPAWCYPLMAILPAAHEFSSRTCISLKELLAFPLLSFNERRLPGLLAQMEDIVRRNAAVSTIADEASTLQGYFTRIAVGTGIGLSDEGSAQALRRSDLALIALAEKEQITTYVTYKHQRFGLAEQVKRFLTHVSTLT